MPSTTTFQCFNCRKVRAAEDAVSLSWPVHLGWLFLSGGLVGGVCRECKAKVVFIGGAVTLFFGVAGVAALIYLAA